MEYELNQSYIDKRSAGMAVTSMVLGIIGVVLGFCVYPGFIFGSLAIILGVLSRGGEMTMNGYAKAGTILGTIAIVFSMLMFLFYFATVLNEFGGFEGYMDYIMEMNDNSYSNYYDLYDTF